jgi:hypothetical protein
VPDRHADRVHDEDVVLDIGNGVGALILYTAPELRGQEIEVSLRGTDSPRVHTDIQERLINGRRLFVGVYPDLPEGGYRIWTDDPGKPAEFGIASGQVTEVDWRS